MAAKKPVRITEEEMLDVAEDTQDADEEDAAAMAARVAAGRADADVLELATDYNPEEHGDPPEWADDEDLWERSVRAVGVNSFRKNRWLIAASLYKKLGGKFK